MSKQGSSDGPARSLTDKQAQFVVEYLIDFNATRAAIRAGYAKSSAYQQGYENLRKPHIVEAIKEHTTERAMKADENLLRLSNIARGSIDDIITVDDEGRWYLDLKKARDNGSLSLIKKIWEDKDGYTRVELHDPVRALELLGKANDLFRDRLDITSGGKPIRGITSDAMAKAVAEVEDWENEHFGDDD